MNELIAEKKSAGMEIDDIDLNFQKDKFLEKYSNKLLSYGANELEQEETHIWICYPKKEIEDMINDMLKPKEIQSKNSQNTNPPQSSKNDRVIQKEEKEEIKFPKRKSEIFLFNKLNDKCAHVMSRQKEDEISQIVIRIRYLIF